jgi:predicted secreted Zn-dependent protease
LKIERTEDGGYRLPAFTITVAPEPSRTMARRSVALPDSLLQHEQGHYDIVVLAAHALARELETMTAPAAQALTRQVEDCVGKHTARAQRSSEEYDRQTAHSHDATAQARWTERIRAALEDPGTSALEGLAL